MAALPQATTLNIQGDEVYFINSGDSKIFFTGYAPVVDNTSFENPRRTPNTGSIALTGSLPTALPRSISPATGSLTTSSVKPTVGDFLAGPSTPDALQFTGAAPTIQAEREIAVAATSMSLTGQWTSRWTGLWFFSDPIAVQIEHNRDTGLRALSFTSEAPQVIKQGPIAIVRVPPTGSLTTSGQAPGKSWSVWVQRTQMDFIGKRPSVNNGPIAYPAKRSLGFSGKAPYVYAFSGVTVVIRAAEPATR
jgi:hypothetical protein